MRIALPLLVLSLAGLTSCAGEENWKTSIYGTGGVRMLSEGEWAPVETQTMLGLEGVGRDPRGIWGVEFGGAFSWAEDEQALGTSTVDIDGQVTDIYLGPRLTFELGRFLPFISAGFTWGHSKATAGALGFEEENSTSSAGGYGRAGFDFLFGEHFTLGADARYIFGTHYSLDDSPITWDTDGLVAAVRIGWTF